jgi:hypothetical protein
MGTKVNGLLAVGTGTDGPLRNVMQDAI